MAKKPAPSHSEWPIQRKVGFFFALAAVACAIAGWGNGDTVWSTMSVLLSAAALLIGVIYRPVNTGSDQEDEVPAREN